MRTPVEGPATPSAARIAVTRAWSVAAAAAAGTAAAAAATATKVMRAKRPIRRRVA